MEVHSDPIFAGNQIALAQITQLQQLRELMAAQIQASGTYMAAQQQAEASKAASLRDATEYRDPREGWKPRPVKIGNCEPMICSTEIRHLNTPAPIDLVRWAQTLRCRLPSNRRRRQASQG